MQTDDEVAPLPDLVDEFCYALAQVIRRLLGCTAAEGLEEETEEKQDVEMETSKR